VLLSGEEQSALVGCKFQNTSAARGGALYVDRSHDVDVTACNFTDTVSDGDGGAVYLWIASATFNSTRFVNTSGDVGGAVYANDNSVLTFEYCTFDATSAKSSGGAIHSESTMLLSVRGCTFVAAAAGERGGGLWLGEGALLSLAATSFKGASALSGGAVFAFRAKSLTMDSVHFSDNVATAAGGALFCQACDRLDLLKSSFSNNYAEIGAAIYGSNLVETWIIANTSFSNNTALGQGAFDPTRACMLPIYPSEDPVCTQLRRTPHFDHGMVFKDLGGGSSTKRP